MLLPTLFALGAAAGVLAQYPGYGGGPSSGGGGPGSNGNGGGGDDNGGGNGDTSSASSTPTPTSTTSANDTSSGLLGGKLCTNLLCITALVNSSTTTYELAPASATTPGWMAIGFGQQMSDTPMVIMWANSDGSLTLSQRMAPAEVTPTVQPSPPRIATVDTANSNVQAAAPTYAFTIPTDGSGTSLPLIWAFSSVHPSSSAVDAALTQHDNSGPITISLSAVSANGTIAESAASTSPFLSYQACLFAHGVLMVLGFMLFLPTGVLIARWFRLAGPRGWFVAHSLIQFYLAGPVILSAFIIAIVAIQQTGGSHFNDTHKLVGIVVVALYFAQVALGGIIHFVKDPNRTARPPQNYGHAILGLGILGLAFYNVHRGYDYEWPTFSGRPPVPSGVNTLYIVWIILIPVAYVAGLFLLRKQYRAESSARAHMHKMEMRSYPRPSRGRARGSSYADPAMADSTVPLSAGDNEM